MGLWLRIALIVALAILLWILVVDLAENVDEAGGPLAPSASADPAANCAEFVRSYRGLEGEIQVVGAPTQRSEGEVAIEWRGRAAGGAPVEGSAACTFAVGAGGRLTLVEATVDGAPVDEASLASRSDDSS